MRLLKKFVALTLCASVVMCSACSIDDINDKLTGKGWKKDAAEIMADTFDNTNYGEVYLCGKTYSFPFKVSELLDDGWTYSTDYENINEETLEPKYFITDWVDMIAPDGESKVSMMCFNDTEEEILLKECWISSLKVEYNGIDEAMFSGGTAICDVFDTKEEAIAAFNCDKMTWDEEASSARQFSYIDYFTSNDVDCSVQIYIGDTGSNSFYINRIVYEALSFSSYTPMESLIASLEVLVKYDRSNFDLMFDDYDEYFAYFNPYIVDSVVYYAGFNCSEQLTDEQIDKINNFLKEISTGIEFTAEQVDDKVVIEYVCPNLNELIEVATNDASEKYTEETGNDITLDLLNDTTFMNYFVEALCSLSGSVKYMPSETIEYTYDEEFGLDTDSFADAIFTIFGFYSEIESADVDTEIDSDNEISDN